MKRLFLTFSLVSLGCTAGQPQLIAAGPEAFHEMRLQIAQRDQPRAAGLRLRNGVIITLADPIDGLIVWVVPEAGDKSTGALARFDPVSFTPWVEQVNHHVADTSAALPPALASLDRGSLWFRRPPQPTAGPLILEIQSHPDSAVSSYQIAGATLDAVLLAWQELGADAAWISDLPPELQRNRPRFALEELDEPLRRIDGPQLVYPEHLRQQGIGGSVWMSYMIDSLGTVPDGTTQVLFADYREFAHAAVTVIQRSQFSRPQQNGRPISVRVFQAAEFRVTR